MNSIMGFYKKLFRTTILTIMALSLFVIAAFAGLNSTTDIGEQTLSLKTGPRMHILEMVMTLTDVTSGLKMKMVRVKSLINHQ